MARGDVGYAVNDGFIPERRHSHRGCFFSELNYDDLSEKEERKLKSSHGVDDDTKETLANLFAGSVAITISLTLPTLLSTGSHLLPF